MGKSSSVDLRDRIIGEIERGHSCRSAARRFGVSAATAVRLAQRKARTGSVAPARQGRPAGSGPLEAHADVLVDWVVGDGDITMPELAARLLAERRVKAQPRPQSHRNGLCQAQGASASRQGPNHRNAVTRCRLDLRTLLTRRMLELPQTCRICRRLNARCSRRRNLRDPHRRHRPGANAIGPDGPTAAGLALQSPRRRRPRPTG